jgi:hypothetical protein
LLAIGLTAYLLAPVFARLVVGQLSQAHSSASPFVPLAVLHSASSQRWFIPTSPFGLTCCVRSFGSPFTAFLSLHSQAYSLAVPHSAALHQYSHMQRTSPLPLEKPRPSQGRL